jgi:predicted dehydrogenase
LYYALAELTEAIDQDLDMIEKERIEQRLIKVKHTATRPVQAQLAQLAPQQKTMGPLTLTRSSEEHGGPHEGWFWDPTRQGGGVLCDMGCHSIAVGWYALTPLGKPVTFLKPIAVTADTALLKWGQPQWRDKLLKDRGVDYAKTPAEDFATGLVTFQNPETRDRR